MVNTINVTIQNSVPDALRGRVMALYVTVFAGTAPIGGLFAGALAQAFGAPVAFSIGAAAGRPGSSPWSPGSCARSRRCRRLRRRPAEPEALRHGRHDGRVAVVSMSNLSGG